MRRALFAECLFVGLLTAIALIPVVTALPALAAACGHLRAAVEDRDTSTAAYVRRFREACRGCAGTTAAFAGAAGLLLLDRALSQHQDMPGGPAMVVAAGIGLVLVLAVLVRTAAAWSPGAAWPGLARATIRQSLRDPSGTALLFSAVVLTGLLTWALPPLAVPALGCLALAAIAVEVRAGRSVRTSIVPAPTADRLEHG